MDVLTFNPSFFQLFFEWNQVYWFLWSYRFVILELFVKKMYLNYNKECVKERFSVKLPLLEKHNDSLTTFHMSFYVIILNIALSCLLCYHSFIPEFAFTMIHENLWHNISL